MKTSEKIVREVIEKKNKQFEKERVEREAKALRTGKIIEGIFKLLFGLFLIGSFSVGITKCMHSFAQ